MIKLRHRKIYVYDDHRFLEKYLTFLKIYNLYPQILKNI